MSIRPDNFFEEEIGRGNVRRDRQGNALLIPAGMPKDGPRAPYTPASSLSSYLSDLSHIRTWETKLLTRAMGQNPDLAALAATETYTTGFDKPTDQAGLRENAASGRRLLDIANRALDRVRIHEKADYGTAVHALTEPGNGGVAPERMQPSVDSFQACLQRYGIKIWATEVFTANDDLMAAGTFDHLVEVPGFGVVIADKKTGRHLDGQEFAVQLSDYANSDVYDPYTDERSDFSDLCGSQDINKSLGLVFHVFEGVTDLYWLDLEEGYEAAQRAAWNRDYQAKTDILTEVDDKPILRALKREQAEVLEMIGTATLASGLDWLWRRYNHLWTDDMTAAAKARKEAIS